MSCKLCRELGITDEDNNYTSETKRQKHVLRHLWVDARLNRIQNVESTGYQEKLNRIHILCFETASFPFKNVIVLVKKLDNRQLSEITVFQDCESKQSPGFKSNLTKGTKSVFPDSGLQGNRKVKRHSITTSRNLKLRKRKETQHNSSQLKKQLVKSCRKKKPKVGCKFCGRFLAAGYSLKCHLRTHTGEQPLKCKDCGKGFNQLVNFKRHALIHSGERPFKCETCGKSFRQSGNMQIHKRLHTGEKPFQCAQCGQKFARDHHLKRHLLIHTGKKSNECKDCGKKFARIDELRSHENIHTGQKNFKCKYCGRRFSWLSGLKLHVRSIHTGEKPYKCENCGKSFAHCSNLKVHVKTHS